MIQNCINLNSSFLLVSYKITIQQTFVTSVCFSGTELSNIVYPKLTTVEPPLYQMGKKAAELILEKIKDPASPNHSIVLDAEIKMRASTPRLEVY